MKLKRKSTIGLTVAGALFAGVIWFNYGPVPGYQHLSLHDLLRIRQAIRRVTSEPIVGIIREGLGAVGVMTGKRGSGLDGGGIEYQLNETSSGWNIVGRSSWMSALPNHRPEVDARLHLQVASNVLGPAALRQHCSA